MTSPSDTFFEALSKRRHEPLLRKGSGTVRITLMDGPNTHRWLIAVDRGDIRVSRDGTDTAADCVLVTTRSFFDDVVMGEANAMAGLLRGQISIAGDPELLNVLERLFPGPKNGRQS
jgi:putative sterol carrier protein